MNSIFQDFTFAHPIQKCAVLPKLLENVPGGAPPDLPGPLAYLDLAADKKFFLSALAEKEKKRTGTTDMTKLIETSSNRNFFELSHHVAAIHQEFAVRFCTRSGENLTAAMEELEHFLADNTGFSRDDLVIMEVVKSLRDQLALVSP
ncbi:hypothetical protein MMC30_008837 [Trapelia coarctata]|nr:hypothetical protein [Trapelia coarctata]